VPVVSFVLVYFRLRSLGSFLDKNLISDFMSKKFQLPLLILYFSVISYLFLIFLQISMPCVLVLLCAVGSYLVLDCVAVILVLCNHKNIQM
jgi:hypothetical protein